VKAGRVVSKKCKYCDKPVYGGYISYCKLHKSHTLHNTIDKMISLGIWSNKYRNSKLKILTKVLKRKSISNDIKTYFKDNC